MAFPLSTAALIGILVQSALYGLYLVFFVGSLYTTNRRRLRGGLRSISTFLFVVTIVLFLLITAHWVIQILEIVDAFILKVDGDPSAYYLHMGNPKYLTKASFHVSQTIVADSTMVYRLYIVWGKSWRVIVLPLALTLGLAGSGIMFINSFSRNSPARVDSGAEGFVSVVSFFGATLLLNLIISGKSMSSSTMSTKTVSEGLISYRICSINRSTAGSTGQRRHSIIYILLENAMLYLACLSSTLVGFIFGDAYEVIPLDATGPVIGIAFCLIMIWVELGMGVELTSQLQRDLNFHHSGEITTQNSYHTPV